MTARPATFAAFLRSLGVRLTRAQRVLCSVAFDGVEPSALRGADRDVARSLFGDVATIPPTARAVVAIVAGARAGKSYIGALWLLWRCLVSPLDSLAPGERAVALIVAPDLRLARQVLRYVAGAIKAKPELAKLVASESTDAIVLARPDGRSVAIECLPATRGGSAVRGRSLVAALLDESAFFRDSDYQINDVDVFAAVAPRIIPGGQVLLASTPWAEAGLLYELWRDNFGAPSTALVAHAPTTLLRDDERTLAMVERERQRDPDNAEREFGAQFMPAGSGLFFEPALLDRATELDAPTAEGACFAAVDLAFRSDASALVVVRSVGELLTTVEALELRPTKAEPLKPSAVVAHFAARLASWGVHSVATDVHYVETARELFAAHGVAIVEGPAGLAGKVDTYTALRDRLREGTVRIDPDERRLLAQLRGIIARPTSGGGLQISAPRRGGQHGDIASAFVLACWAASSVVIYTPEQMARQREVNRRFDSLSRWGGQRHRGFG